MNKIEPTTPTELDGILALSHASLLAKAQTPLSNWPEKLGWVFAFSFFILVVDKNIEKYEMMKFIMGISFMGYVICTASSIRSLKEKLGALAELRNNEIASNLSSNADSKAHQ